MRWEPRTKERWMSEALKQGQCASGRCVDALGLTKQEKPLPRSKGGKILRAIRATKPGGRGGCGRVGILTVEPAVPHRQHTVSLRPAAALPDEKKSCGRQTQKAEARWNSSITARRHAYLPLAHEGGGHVSSGSQEAHSGATSSSSMQQAESRTRTVAVAMPLKHKLG